MEHGAPIEKLNKRGRQIRNEYLSQNDVTDLIQYSHFRLSNVSDIR